MSVAYSKPYEHEGPKESPIGRTTWYNSTGPTGVGVWSVRLWPAVR